MSDSNATQVVILFALEREAAPFRRVARELAGVQVAVSGIGKARARIAAERVVATSPRLVIAAGFCGALEEGLAVGDIVRPIEVVNVAGHAWTCCRVGNQTGRMLTADRLVATSHDKLELGLRHRAASVDMESAAIAEVCAKHGIPFLAVRAVSDSVETELSLRLVRLLSGGRVSVGRACLALLRTPRLLGEFRRLARDTRVAGINLAAGLLTTIDAFQNGGARIYTPSP